MRFISIICLLFLVISCQKKDTYSDVQIFGHAGMGLKIENTLYHDNSEEAIDLALNMKGCDGVEIDIQLSSDNELFLFHDATLEVESNGSGCINNQSSIILNQLHYHTILQEKIVQLKNVDWSKYGNKTVFLDIRHLNHCNYQTINIDSMIQQIINVTSNSLIDFKMIISNPDWLNAFQNAGLKTYFNIPDDWTVEFTLSNYYSPDGYVLRNKYFQKSDVELLKNAGKSVYIYDVRSPKGIRSAFKKNPTGIISDDVRATILEKY